MTAAGPEDAPGLQTGRDEDWVGPLLAMLAVQTAVSFLSRIAPTLAPTLAPRIGWPVESVGYLSSTVTGASVFALLLGMPLLRRYGSMRNLQVGLALGVLGALLSAVPESLALVIGTLLIGVSIGPPSSAGMDVLQRFAPLRHRNLLFSVKQAGVPLGGVLAGLLLPWASQALGIGVAVTIAAAIGALTLFAVQPLRARVDAARERTLRIGRAEEGVVDTGDPKLAGFIADRDTVRGFGATGWCGAMRLDRDLQCHDAFRWRGADRGGERAIHHVNRQVEQEIDDPRRLGCPSCQGVEQVAKLGANPRQAQDGGEVGIKLDRPHRRGIAPSTARLQALTADFGLTSRAKRPFSHHGRVSAEIPGCSHDRPFPNLRGS